MDETLKVWEVESGRELRTLQGHTGPVRGMAMRGDGRLAVSVSYDTTLKVWDVANGVSVAGFTCDSSAYCCAFAESLHIIVVGDSGGHVHFLRLEEPRARS